MELLTGTPPFATMTCTIQKEVGQRIAAPACCADYGPVSVIAQTLAEIETIAELPPEVFWPRPQVDSVAMRLVRRADADVAVDDISALRRLVQTAFRQRRKMLRGALKSLEIDDLPAVLQACGISPEARAESVALSEWHALQRVLSARTP
jgi:16S rRNA (adenine1518-N6/adenine1519-N6)-dimethyltransferase